MGEEDDKDVVDEEKELDIEDAFDSEEDPLDDELEADLGETDDEEEDDEGGSAEEI